MDVGLLSSDRDGVRTLTIDRPEVRNAVTVELRLALAAALTAADADPAVRVVVVTGAGGNFCSGADLGEMDTERTPEEARVFAGTVAQAVFRALRAMGTPTVARVEGAAAWRRTDWTFDLQRGMPVVAFGAGPLAIFEAPEPAVFGVTPAQLLCRSDSKPVSGRSSPGLDSLTRRARAVPGRTGEAMR